MAIKSATYITTAVGAIGFGYAIKHFLVNELGWIVKGSGDGSTGGMDGVDRIVSASAFSSGSSWVVLATPGDDVQLLLDKGGGNATSLGFAYNPGNDYAGGAHDAFPTSTASLATDVYRSSNANWSVSGFYVHITGDDNPDAPAWAALVTSSTGSERAGLYCVPLTQRPAGANAPYVVGFATGQLFRAHSSSLGSKNAASSGRNLVQLPGTPAAPVPMPAAMFTMAGSTGVVFPNRALADADGNDLLAPIMWADQDGHYCGFSTFMQWTGVSRNRFDTLDNKRWMVFGDAAVAWDGSTDPL